MRSHRRIRWFLLTGLLALGWFIAAPLSAQAATYSQLEGVTVPLPELEGDYPAATSLVVEWDAGLEFSSIDVIYFVFSFEDTAGLGCTSTIPRTCWGSGHSLVLGKTLEDQPAEPFFRGSFGSGSSGGFDNPDRFLDGRGLLFFDFAQVFWTRGSVVIIDDAKPPGRLTRAELKIFGAVVGDPCVDLGGDSDHDTLCDDEDPCKFFPNTLPLVIDPYSGIPCECLCGDVDGDCFLSATDAAAVAGCAAFVRFDCVSERDEVTGPCGGGVCINDGFYSATDAVLVNRVAAFLEPAYVLECGLRPEGTCGGMTGVACQPWP